ncbi:hypothetical protein SAY87_018995 [Trapa incisa]|uniref:Uncharacterized protein n=1 Tax=Trapa incisa TaxID=236973 RepID=A0AAN7K3T1_9MYRT|nr:hypothetical protein SAY87_018995 [Trapa incisa]
MEVTKNDAIHVNGNGVSIGSMDEMCIKSAATGLYTNGQDPMTVDQEKLRRALLNHLVPKLDPSSLVVYFGM